MKQISSNINLESTEINEKYCGPPMSGNGGYIAGIIANQIQNNAAVVKIKAPAPLNQTLFFSNDFESSRIKLIIKESNILIAEGQEDKDFYLDVPEFNAKSIEEIRNPIQAYLGFKKHPFSTCFVCGTERKAKDGMRIFPAKISDQSKFNHLHGSFWNPWKELGDSRGKIFNEIVWAALDCPGGFAVSFLDPRMIVLVKLRARLMNSVFADTTYAIQAWEISRNRRQRIAGTAIYQLGDFKCVAYSEAIWMIPEKWNTENQKQQNQN
ncbi:hypothetical protein EHQ92_17870 [Leptospira biflexa]|uniref:hypothetical protein n=1 Tax=Leptospira biflexa TaxID=172 RepID=UPI0010829782|nr:hypothetical protein [Leptospira biflexa]TGM34002.1 hypothetical protein EHQ80_15590 [Leptospira biflexa]TGM39505.1 hypothetical protein EHQ89_06820 [Leptospira biflexa]TGM41768.1 hypothetical protein EHQ92_17870 [Leptospira biflexa]TGM51920.1 hypothetical protein EHQ88_00025 [Leptospira biflexa]